MSVNNDSDITAISPAGYTEFLKTHFNSSQLFSPPFDPSVSHQLYAHNTPDPTNSSLRSLLDDQIDHAAPADNNLVVELRCQLMELQHTVASLRADLLQITNEKASLSLTCHALQNVIVNIRSSASSVASSSSSPSPSDTSITTSDERKPLFLLDGVSGEECDRELDPAEYRSVKSWTKKQWLEQFPQNTSAVPGSSSMKSARGSKRMAQGINVSCTYLQDENGVPVSAQRAKAIRTKMLSCFRQLHTQGLAPESIGQASLDVLKWLVHTLRKEYIELRLCADDWKTMRLMTDNYSQWYSYHVKNKGKRVKVEADDTCLEDESISDNSDKHVAKRPRIDSDTTPEITRDPSPNHPITRDPSPDRQITRDPSPDRQTTPPPRTDKGKQKEVVILEVKNPLSNLAIKPRPRPIPPKNIATSTDSSPSVNTSTPNIIPSPSNDMTQLSLPEVQSSADAASLATKVELVAATPITIDSKNDIIKKRQPSTKPMRVSAKITARNLCAFDWQSNGHQKEPASAFATYWNGLSKADKEVYKCKATAQLKSSGIVGTVHDVDDE